MSLFKFWGKKDNSEDTGAEQSSDDLVKTIAFLNPKYLLLCYTLLSIITHVLTNSIKRFFLIKHLQTKLPHKKKGPLFW